MSRVLVACEYSGVVRRAFRSRGIDCWSCDIIPSDDNSEFHLQCDVRSILCRNWDAMIAHPPCTYLTSAGARWWGSKVQEQRDAIDFVKMLLNSGIPRIAVENPPGKIGTAIAKATQYIHPWQFGHSETKKTGLWLVNLPPLIPTNNVYDEMSRLPPSQRHRIHYMSPGPDRWKNRSRTFTGIADAMASQWGPVIDGSGVYCD